MPNGRPWEYPSEAPTKEEIERGKAFMAAARGGEGPPPKEKERKYEPLPGFGWEWPWPADWEKVFKFPMEALAGQRPWEAWRTPYQGAPPMPETALPEDWYTPPVPWEYSAPVPIRGEKQAQIVSPQLRGWMEQVQAWQKGEIPALPAPPSGFVLPRELEEWYGRVATPELHPRGNVQYYQQQYAGSQPVSLPEDFQRKTDEEQISWLSAHAYETVYTDENGNILDVSEVLRRAQVDPDAPITQVWMMGGGKTKESEFLAADIETVESLKPPRPREAGAEVIGGEWMRPGTPAGERARAQEVLNSSIVQSVLQSEWGYEEKVETIMDLYSQLTGKALGLPARQAVDTAIYQSLTPEQMAAHGKGKPEDIREPVVEGEEPLDVAALSKALAQFGVNLTTNPPYISPITEAHLMRIPSELLKEMARYLESKGLSWQDFLSISSSWYGGGAPERGRWAVPAQWG